jgi:glycosyltransferase involved in cell wall biosynthesis
MKSDWLFVGPTPLSGIGQVCIKYAHAFNGKFVSLQDAKKHTGPVFAFVLPVKEHMDVYTSLNPTVVMTVCETEPVHEDYRLIFDTFPGRVLVPSEFCQGIFKRQFGVETTIFRHAVPPPPLRQKSLASVYTFYTIGNMLDPRKNLKGLLEAFRALPRGSANLIIKSTSLSNIKVEEPNVLVLNGFFDDDQMERIHMNAHCYINCSYSEGVGMGAVEAAVRNKPVIITNFGGLQEYVKTPFVISTTPEPVGLADFLFQPHMMWGKPSVDELAHHMKHCLDKRITTWDHQHTRDITSWAVLHTILANLSLEFAGSPV